MCIGIQFHPRLLTPGRRYADIAPFSPIFSSINPQTTMATVLGIGLL
jgi:hypothetical protein